MTREHEPQTRNDPEGTVAFCEECDRTLFGPSSDTELIELYAQAHRRVSRSAGARGNEVLAASREVGAGKISLQYAEILSEERQRFQ